MRTPDFLVVGTARAGTTALHSYLRQHPDIFLPKLNEPCFFVFEGGSNKFNKGKFAFAIRHFNEYQQLFSRAEANQKIGEMSTPYLYLFEKTISTVKKYFNDYAEIKIIILLRNPVDRAYSQYKWRVRDGREPLHFEEAIKEEKARMNANYSFDYYYVDRGFYYEQVKAYQANFKNVHFVYFDDFNSEPFPVLKDICRFLGVNENVNFKKIKRQNESAAPRSKSLSKLATSESALKFKLWFALPDVIRSNVRRLFSKMNTKKTGVKKMNPLTRQQLIETYRDDIVALQQLTGRDLSEWLK